MAVLCRQCGASNADGAQFCASPGCGAYLNWDGTGPVAPAAQHAAAALTLADATLAATPGETTGTTATVHNGGSQVEQFTVEVLGPTAPWATVEPPTLTVYPGGRAQAEIHWTPPRVPGTAPGRAGLTVRATSLPHPGLRVAANGTLEVGAFREVTASLAPQGTSGRWRTVHKVDLVNSGNVLEPLRVRAADPNGKLHFVLPRGEVPVAAGATHRVPLPVRPRTRWFGQPEQQPFQVTVTPRPEVPAVRLSGNRETVPLIAGWIPKLAAVTALIVVGSVVVYLATPGRRGTATPSAANSVPPVGPSAAAALGQGGAAGGASASAAPVTTPSASAVASAAPSTEAAPSAAPPPAPDACRAGYVWRAAFDSDVVCVTQAVHDQVVADNAAAAGRATSGAYGPDTCVAGYVWREASPTDHVCVTGAARTQTARDNGEAVARLKTPPKQCVSGYVWRQAYPTDYVCVTAATRTQATADNAQANRRRDPTGAYGVTSCASGYVWRVARPTDHVCVTGDVRSQTAYDNSQAASRTV